MGRGLLLSLCCLSLAVQCFCQLQINALATNYAINFDSTDPVPGVSNGVFAGTGFEPTPASGRLDSDAWKITRIANSSGTVISSNYGDTNTGGDFALGFSDIPVSTGGIYAFSGTGISGRAMGFQPSATAFSGAVGSSVELRCINNTAQTITEIQLRYNAYYRNDQNRSSSINVSINQDFFPLHTNLSEYPYPDLDYTSPLNLAGTTWNRTKIPFDLEVFSGLCIRPGEYFYVKWTIVDNGGSGSRDEFALDNILIRATTGVTDPTFYTQNTGEQLGTTGGTMKWSTVPAGNVTFGMYPFIGTADYIIQDTHEMTFTAGGADMSLRNLTVEGGGLFTGNTAASDSSSKTQLNIKGDLTIEENAGLTLISDTVLLNGSWNNFDESQFSEGSSLVIFENLSPGETVINTAGGEIFNDLEIRSGTTVMNSDVEVLNVFDLNAILDLNAQNLAIRSPANMAPVNGSAFEMVISEDTGHLGSMSVNIGTYAVPVEFPFGTDGGEPIYCRFALNGGNAGEVTMATYGTGSNNLPRPVFPEAVNNLIGDLGTVADNANATVDRFWSITTTGSTVDANISLSFLQSEMPTSSPYDDVSLIRAQRYDGSLDRWQPSLPGQVVIQDSPIVGVHRIDVPNVTDFSPWAAAAEGSPLPVELLSFKGSIENGGIALEWSTASEINNSHFILSRFGEDGISKEIATVAGEGNSSSVVNYEWLDSEPLDGLNYYQLTQVDFDGTATDEGTVVVLWKVGSGLAVLAQSWGQDGLYLLTQSRSERLFLEIFDMNGRLLHQSHLSSGQSVTRYTPVHSGIYLARLTDGEDILSIKLPFKAQ